MKGKLSCQLDAILQELKSQNNQINCTLKSLKKVKSQDVMQTKVSKSVIDYTTNQKTHKMKKIEQPKTRKSKTFHRCTSCKIIGDTNHKENAEKSKEIGKKVTLKTKTLSVLQVQRKSHLQKGKSPTRKSNITTKYIVALNAKKTKKQ